MNILIKPRYFVLRFLLLFLALICITSSLYADDYRLELLKKIYSIGTAGISGTYYPVGNSIARVLSSGIKELVVIAEPTAGSIANIGYLKNQQIDLALVQSDVAWMAFNGAENFADNRFRELRILTSLYSEVIQIAVRRDSGIEKLADLRGRKISVGTRESGSAVSFIEVLKAAGLESDDYEIVYERFTMGTESLRDGYVDAVYYAGGVPAAGLQRLGQRIAIRFLPIPAEVIKGLVAKFPYFSTETIEPGSYPGLNSPVSTVGVRALLAATESLPNTETSKILDLIYGNASLISAQSQSGISIRLGDALKGIDQSMLHHGARSFFQQKKLLTP